MTPSRRPVLRVAIPVVLVTALGVGGWWATHPDVFDDAGGFGMKTTDRSVGQTMYFGIVSTSIRDERHELDLRAATPVVSKNTAEAELEVYLCETTPESEYGEVGSQVEKPTNICRVFEPVTDGTRLLTGEGEPHHQLVLGVRATQPGVLKVRGIEVSYRDGLRRGTQVTGGHVTYRAR